jgi:TetR/AcrR family transcriptional regulator, copper-responsive repressor
MKISSAGPVKQNMRTGTKIQKRPRGRPRAFDPDQVLDRVRAVFIEKGFAAASLDDLAAAAGLNRPSLYAAFGDKEQLYIHALKRYGMQMYQGLRHILAGKGRLEKRLATAYIIAIKLYTVPPLAPGCMIVGTATTEAPSHPKIATAAQGLLNKIEDLLAEAFAAAIGAGEMKSDPDPLTRARLAGALFDTLAVRARLRHPPKELEALAMSMLRAICR